MGAKKQKPLLFWNGAGRGKYEGVSVYIAAYSQAEAIRNFQTACNARITPTEIKNYYPKCWSTEMKNFVTPTTPCIYIYSKIGGKKIDTPIRVF